MDTTATQLITGSLKLIGAIGAGNEVESPEDSILQDGLRTLNLILDSWSIDGLLTFDKVAIDFPIEASRRIYPIGDGVASDPDGLLQSSTPSSGAVTMDGALYSSANAFATMDIPRQVLITTTVDETGVVFTVTGTDILGQIITEAMTGANAGTTFSEKLYKTVTAISLDTGATGALTIGSASIIRRRRPLKVVNGFTRTGTTDSPLEIFKRDKHTQLRDKQTTVTTSPVAVFYESSYPSGVIHVYHPTTSSSYQMYLDLWVNFVQIDSLTDVITVLPPEYINPLKWWLALEMAPEYGSNVQPYVFQHAIAMYNGLREFNGLPPRQEYFTQPLTIVNRQPVVPQT